MWSLARSGFYAAGQRPQHPREPEKRGPKVRSDEELVTEIRGLLAQPIMVEGYRKIWARLRFKGVRTSKDRVLRLLRAHQLLSPSRRPAPILVTRTRRRSWPRRRFTCGERMPTAIFTEAEGNITAFAAIDHCTGDCVGIHAVKKATRFEAVEPIRQDVREYFGSFSAAAADGLNLRHDHGSVYMNDDFQSEVKFLGIEPSPGFRVATRGQWVHRAILSHTQRTGLVGPPLPRFRRTAGRLIRVSRSLQQQPDSGATGLSDADPGTS